MGWMVGRKVSKIARMPAGEQVDALRDMAQMVAAQPEEKRREMIRLMQDAIGQLPPLQAKGITENRMKAISGLPTGEREILMRSMDAVMGKTGMSPPTPPVEAGGTPKEMPQGNVMVTMVRSLAALPEAERRTMVDSRLQTFLSMGEGDRVQGMSSMVEAGISLPREDYVPLVKTRTSALCAFSPVQRETLAQAHMMALMKVSPEVAKKELESMGQALMSLPAADRETFVQTMKHIMGSLPPSAKQQMMEKLPPGMKQMLATA